MFNVSYRRGGGLRFVKRPPYAFRSDRPVSPAPSAKSRAVSDRDEIELPAWVRPGAQYRMLNQLWHVRAIVDGGPVCRTWRPQKKRWRYEWIDPEAFIGSTSIEQV
jgi:hypothetical protein